MIRLITESFGWIADASGESLTLRTDRAREIIQTIKPNKKYRVEIKEYRPRRSLDQNDMYWAILQQVAKALRISNLRCHNMMLCRYGVIEQFDGHNAFAFLPDTDETEEKVAESEHVHYKPTSEIRVGADGESYRIYYILRGSSAMDTAEMTRLIEGVMDEARQMGLTLIMEG